MGLKWLIFQYTFMALTHKNPSSDSHIVQLELESHQYTSAANIHHCLGSWDKCCPHHASGVLYGVTNVDPSCASASLALVTPEALSPNHLLLWHPNPTHHRMVLLAPCCWRLWNGRQFECMTVLCCNFKMQSRYPLKNFKSTVATIFTISLKIPHLKYKYYICTFYDFQNKQQLFPWTTLTNQLSWWWPHFLWDGNWIFQCYLDKLLKSIKYAG